MRNPLVRYVPATPQVQFLELLQSLGDPIKSSVRNITTPAEFQQFQIRQHLRDPVERRVSHLLAQRKVQFSERAELLKQSTVNARVGDVVAAGKVEGFQVGDAFEDVAESSSEGQDLYPLNAPS